MNMALKCMVLKYMVHNDLLIKRCMKGFKKGASYAQLYKSQPTDYLISSKVASILALFSSDLE